MQKREGGKDTDMDEKKNKRRERQKLWRELRKFPQRKSKMKQTNCLSALKKCKDAVPDSETENVVLVDGIDSNECMLCLAWDLR